MTAMPEDRRDRIADGPATARAQIADDIRADIDSGRLKKGDRLPALTDLVETYGVARDTIRRALDILVDEGRIIRVQGLGTFVA